MRDINIALDAVALVIVLIIIFGKKQDHINNFDGKLFFFLVWLTFAFVLIDGVFRALDGVAGIPALLITLKTVYLILNAFLLFAWVIYVDYKIFEDFTALRKRITYYIIPVGINVALVIINIFTPFIFHLSFQNVIEFNTLGITIYTAINYAYMIYYLVLVLFNKKKIRRNDFLPLLIFSLPALICSVVQIVFKGLSLVCGYALTALVIYVHLQNALSYEDGLTGILNRRSLTDYLKGIFKEGNKDYYLSGIMLDVDDLKGINDVYGHMAGDDVLISIANILTKSVAGAHMLCRYAGDEFMVICRSKDISEPQCLIAQIEQNREEFNANSNKEYKVNFSVGIYTTFGNECTSIDSFLKQTDDAMYAVKNKKSSHRRRIDDTPNGETQN